MSIKEYVLNEKEYIIEMRRHFHAHPEVSLKEYETCKKIENELDTMGIPHRRVGETGETAAKQLFSEATLTHWPWKISKTQHTTHKTPTRATPVDTTLTQQQCLARQKY